MKYIKDRKCNPRESTKTECLHRNAFPRISSHGKKINLITKHRQHIFGDGARDEYRYLWFRWETFKQANQGNPNDSISGSLFLAKKLGNDPIWRRRVIRNSSAHSFSWSKMRHINDAETTAAILFKNEGTEQDWGREKRDCPILLINFYQSKSQKRGIICWTGGQGQFSYPGNVATCILVGDAAGMTSAEDWDFRWVSGFDGSWLESQTPFYFLFGNEINYSQDKHQQFIVDCGCTVFEVRYCH